MIVEIKDTVADLCNAADEVVDYAKKAVELTEKLDEQLAKAETEAQRPYAEFLQSGGAPMDWMIKEFENA